MPFRVVEAGEMAAMSAGHSLGGALGVLAAYDIATAATAAGHAIRLACYTFGAPRVGSHLFAADHEAVVPDTWSIVNDQVCSWCTQHGKTNRNELCSTVAKGLPVPDNGVVWLSSAGTRSKLQATRQVVCLPLSTVWTGFVELSGHMQ